MTTETAEERMARMILDALMETAHTALRTKAKRYQAYTPEEVTAAFYEELRAKAAEVARWCVAVSQ